MKADCINALFVNHAGQLGGAEINLLELLSQLKVNKKVVLFESGPLLGRLESQGIDVRVIDAGKDLFQLACDTPVLRRAAGLRDIPRALTQLVRIARDCDLIYVNTKKALVLALLTARMTRRPLVWNQQDEMRSPNGLSFREKLSEHSLVTLLNRYGSKIFSVSKACAESFVAAGGRPELPVVLYTGLDPLRFASYGDRRAIRLKVGLPADVPLIGCFGRITVWKGQRVLLEAMPHIPGAHVAFVGGPILAEKGFLESLHSLTMTLGLSDRVHFLGFRDNVPELMSAVDVVAHPSLTFDPCPRVVLETLHSGIPLVATSVGGVPEMVESGVSGLIVPPSDPVSLASALRCLLKDRELAVRLASNGRERAQELFTLDRLAREVEREMSLLVDRN